VVSSAFLADELLSVTPGILPSAPSGPASPFAPLLRRSACARESNQREHTLGVAPARSAGALRAAGVSLTGHPALQRNERGPSRSPACGARGPVPSALRRATEGPKR